jgi:Domain of unknown function (DUF4150)/GHH signature containing HNH/Endo VII superfamily nuclease toxin  2
MANEVYANGLEIACKAASGKTIAAMPDVCLSPPSPPAGPVPIPYPNTAYASDTTDGSKTVQISGQEVVLKDKSTFKKSTGDEAATKSLGMGVVSHQIQGKVNFTSWSMDVKIEGENAARHLDLTLHNEMSMPANTPTWPYVDMAALTPDHPCHDSVREEQKACDPNANPPGAQPRADSNGNNCTAACAEARACALPKKKHDKAVCCHPNTTGDHLVEVNCFTQTGGRGGTGLPSEAVLNAIEDFSVSVAQPKTRPRRLANFEKYNDEQAPTACVRPPGSGTNHNRMQDRRDAIKRRYRRACRGVPLEMWGGTEESFWTYDEAANAGVSSHQRENRRCNPACTRAQLDAYHHSCLDGDSPEEKNATPVRTYIPSR